MGLRVLAALSQETLQGIIEEILAPGQSLTAMLNLYRANIGPASFGPGGAPLPAVKMPTLGIWGTRDNMCGEQQMRDSERRADA